ncbi:MAG: hypothetical protein V1751_11505, partial [Pseudomonadota bacterium]
LSPIFSTSVLAYSHAHAGRFTSRVYQKLVGVDIYTASKDIKDLIRQNIVRPLKKGGGSMRYFHQTGNNL